MSMRFPALPALALRRPDSTARERWWRMPDPSDRWTARKREVYIIERAELRIGQDGRGGAPFLRRIGRVSEAQLHPTGEIHTDSAVAVEAAVDIAQKRRRCSSEDLRLL